MSPDRLIQSWKLFSSQRGGFGEPALPRFALKIRKILCDLSVSAVRHPFFTAEAQRALRSSLVED